MIVRRRVRALLVSVAVLAAATGWQTVPPPTADAVPTSTQRTEQPFASSSPVPGVVSSVVRHRVPLPASVGPHPAACDWIGYLRYRSVDGPSDPKRADRILIAQPGIFEGAGSFESVARNTVAAAAAAGVHIEFWALDRRSNCLEDHTGLRAGLAERSLATAADYYAKRTTIDGRRFAGFPTPDSPRLAWLAHVDLRQTLNDQYAIMRAELPDRRARKQTFLCGGHSLGGSITGHFAEWDFDGDPRTRDDAGHQQCGGWFALDSTVSAGAPSSGGPREVGQILDAVAGAGTAALPVLWLPTLINAETMNLLALVGLATHLDPDAVGQVMDALPHNPNVDTSLRFLLAKDYGAAIAGQPDVRRLRATNEAVLGMLLDDDVQPVGILQASMGFVRPDDPMAPRSFPTPAGGRLPMLDDAPKYAPSAFDGHVYRWVDYDEVGTDRVGTRTPGPEVTSIGEIARDLSEPPLDFTEWYFPTALTVSLQNRAGAVRARHHRYPGAASHAPMITFRAGVGRPAEPSGAHGVVVTLPGYNHIDVVSAARDQPDGGPEQVSHRLAEFAAPHS